jgi:hypothetical protein
VLPTLLHRQKLHCATNTAASSSAALCYQHFCILINCIVLPTLLHRRQLLCATNTAASWSTALWYQNCCILINCSVLPTLLHPHKLHCATDTAASSSTSLCYQHFYILTSCIIFCRSFLISVSLLHFYRTAGNVEVSTCLAFFNKKYGGSSVWRRQKKFLRAPDFWWDHRFQCQSDIASCQFINAAEYNTKFRIVINPLLNKLFCISQLH